MKNLSMKKIMKKEQGFTLLELLVVITLLAILSVGALVAYDGVGDNAQATAAANNTAGADRSIRTYRAIELKYPSQWDNLVAKDGTTPVFLAANTTAAFGKVTLPAGAFTTAVASRLEAVGITDIQTRLAAPKTGVIDPNLQHNEGAVGADVVEEAVTALTNISVMPAFTTAACTVGGAAISRLDGAALSAADSARLNIINDSLEGDECHFVVAVGFGHDAAHSTAASSVAVSTAPTYVSKDINPAKNYARYVALFHMGTEDATAGDVTLADLKAKPTLIAVVDTEGKVIDESIAKMNP
ncbi:MAG: prepilin-type N-terminal cleavage/methylation domain-containing protein [Methylotenera sp.]|uniref:type II secretion system protein n=1 Tax=Methylotenera sp. TaxID=2051956 RepID=UPI00271703AC|nr:prepilin-type N-terminal cleavage/methylation domain-containing protein [Methylotenera sp.]MDO9394891.1 prepilin-type N-terminal cleavage/methylation domain-containing protein [Methylotenera sp.]MDP1523549.1 prepilin-type N-terminal cleavage/methylation domain-containing protein [Methylotenera sp.]MDP3817936.1 prepilin-type N-terminal cleavage/methylation domain-containing protein [Methylotenera sp.]